MSAAAGGDHPDLAWIAEQNARVKAYPAATVLAWYDGSIAYRTGRPAEEVDAWLIVRPDGTVIGAGLVTVEQMDPLYNWLPLQVSDAAVAGARWTEGM